MNERAKLKPNHPTDPKPKRRPSFEDDVPVSLDSDEGEPWLVSYADMMTLLFGFFAMLFTFATFEDEDVVKMRKDVAKYFGGTYVAPNQKVAEDIKFAWGKTPYVNDMDLRVSEDGLEISFITSILFTTGGATYDAVSAKPLQVLVELIKSTQKKFIIKVEGHTDDTPLSSKMFPSNWELSAARASAVVRLFESSGLPPDSLSAIGYGSTRPAFPNRDADGKPIPDNQAHNRRVVIKVVSPKEASKPGKEAAKDEAARSTASEPPVTNAPLDPEPTSNPKH